MKKKMIGLLVSMMTVAFSLRGCKEAGKIEETNSEEMTESTPLSEDNLSPCPIRKK